jgi:ankyrin repeat protein
MRRDLRAVRHLLSTSPELALYTDRQAESMLHLAAIFNQGEIAVALLEAGARLDTTNSHRETPLEIAQPALKKRLLECQKRLESRRLT